MSTEQMRDRAGATTDRTSLRSAGLLLLSGQVLHILVTQLHPGGDANDHTTIFAEYAGSDLWKAVHVGQFLAMALIAGGLLALSHALEASSENAAWTARLGSASAVVALGLYAVLQAVDGIGNKEVDDAWVRATPADEATRFADAEAMRWLEWGTRSYHDFALGVALLLLSAAALRASRVPQVVAYLMGLSGVAYLVQGWVVGSDGFSGTHTILILIAWVLSLIWMVWMVWSAVVTGRAPSRRETSSGVEG